MRILNLYAGIGGNRKMWEGHEVVAVENDVEIAKAYNALFPEDKIYVADAHQFLIDHYKEFDMIWSSPPCPTHSQYRFNVGVKGKGFAGVYPDMTLYQEIIFLKHHFDGIWVVENTRSYYEPLIKPTQVSRHYVWSNFEIGDIKIETTGIRDKNKIGDLEKFFRIDMTKYKMKNKRQVLRNCVNPILGKHILDQALQNYKKGAK